MGQEIRDRTSVKNALSHIKHNECIKPIGSTRKLVSVSVSGCDRCVFLGQLAGLPVDAETHAASVAPAQADAVQILDDLCTIQEVPLVHL